MIFQRPELQDLPESWPGGQNWFWHGDQIMALLDEYKPKVCVELGSWRGGSAIAVARAVRQWGGHITCVDVWEMFSQDVTIAECARNILYAGVSPSVRLIQARTSDAADAWYGEIDYLYVDASHSYDACLSDLERWWPFLKVGGLIAVDDYGDPQYGVTQACDEFEWKYGQVFQRKATPGTDPEGTQLIWGIKR